MMFASKRCLVLAVFMVVGVLCCFFRMFSYMQLLMVIWGYLAGLLCAYQAFGHRTEVPNLLVFLERKRKDRCQDDDEFLLLKKVCPVCGERNCPRHRPELNILALQPWTDLKLPSRIDTAFEELLSLVLKNFVYTWYRDISDNEAFVDELRASMRFMAAILYRRLKKIDLPTLVTEKMINAGVKHLHYYLEELKKGGKNSDIQQAIFESLGTNLHIAVRNRNTELDYLRKLIESLFPYILSKQSLRCRSLCSLLSEILSGSVLLPLMDLLADPDIINKLILLLIDESPPPVCNDPLSDDVTLLADYGVPLSNNNSFLRIGGLADILQNQDALFPFMQFLKQEASINVLMFCLAADDFNQKILNPDLSPVTKQQLHTEANEMYNIYFSPSAPDKILFDDEIVQELKTICDCPPNEITKLQRTTCLFRAYEQAYNLLEKTFLPLFHQSDDYYIWLCGKRHTFSSVRSASSSSLSPKPANAVRKAKASEQFALSKIGNKLKGVFRSQTVDGKIDPDFLFTDSAEDILAGTEIPTEPFLDEEDAEQPMHDLSAWRVNIPCIETSPDPENLKKVIHMFSIEVRRLDVLEQDEFQSSNWTVNRRYNEFYAMEQKLREFHGEFPDCKPPPKKSLGTKSAEFLESKRLVFEKYLQKLLTVPKLRGSQLLFTFLTSEEEITTSLLPDINFGKMFKSVPLKLIKEKGQHLDPFLNSFFTSTEAAKPRPSNDEKDSDSVSISSENLANPMYENNANTDLHLPLPENTNGNSITADVEGIFDTIKYLAESVFDVKPWVKKALAAFGMVGKRSLEHYIDWLLGQKFDQVTAEHRVVSLIHRLRDVLFFDEEAPRTDKDKIARKEAALKGLIEYIPKIVVMLVGEKVNANGVTLVFGAVQNPKLNKQLCYTLLDCLLAEIFPELAEVDPESSGATTPVNI
ncbi:sorting nexin-14-like [Tubulanus polymorphus]|uniref:sorting nexin-14-like n=1 Tax=Tubulanus polymorphus TaxID=672921 RepID=UPI003DA270B3